MNLFFPHVFYHQYREHSTAVVQRPSKPSVAGSNPAARSSPYYETGARNAPHEGCMQGSAVPAPKRQRPGDPVVAQIIN